jgi:hypothetical protein
MHAIIVSHAAIKAANRRVYRALAERDCRVTLLIPDRWKSGLGPLRAEPEDADSPLDVRVRRRIGVAHSNLYWLEGALRTLVRPGEPAAIYVDSWCSASKTSTSAIRHRSKRCKPTCFATPPQR